MVKTTVSLIKADVGSIAGHMTVPKPLLDLAKKHMIEAVNSDIICSYCL